ncbi:hypothetical protein ABIB40_002791 [Pedobacter sp. UYP30]|uniref:DUF3347 domain-containing protein n=1 Tax=Pedobacter sp. UYP30 TaxID=1756400 RepID=UPI00339B6834
MKNKIFALGLVTLFFACNQSEKKQADAQDSTIKTSVVSVNDVRLKDKKKAAIFTQYLALKDALVQTNATETAAAAKTLQPLLADYEGCEKDATMADNIAKSDNVEAQRVEFTHLSTDLIALFKNAELSAGTIYVQHCPMANKGDGGDWLSANKEVKNPYYGDKMLKCGSVVDEIKSK